MIYIFTALFFEASPIIMHYDLKKNTSETKFQTYENNDITLVISGIGQINMAIAVAHTMATAKSSMDDFIINIGTAAGNNKGAYLINKIEEEVTGRTYFTDILYKHDFDETEIVSGMKVSQTNDYKECLYDMEAASFYQAALKYVWQDHIFIIKIVSDDFNPLLVSSDNIILLIKNEIEKIDSLIEHMKLYNIKRSKDNSGYLNKLTSDMHCSVTMAEQLRHLVMYLELIESDYQSVIEEYYIKGKLPCKNKKEGKGILYELQKRLL